MSESRGYLSFKTSKGEAVVCYREPLATLKMGCHRLSQRVNKMESFFKNYISFILSKVTKSKKPKEELTFFLPK